MTKPICTECKKGDIIKVINYSNYCAYDENIKGFKLISVEHNDVWYRCEDCQTEYNESEVMEMMI